MSEGIERATREKVFGNKTYHFYQTVTTRDMIERKERWLMKRGYEFKVFTNGGQFDIYTYPPVS